MWGQATRRTDVPDHPEARVHTSVRTHVGTSARRHDVTCHVSLVPCHQRACRRSRKLREDLIETRRAARLRFGASQLHSRLQGLRPIVKAMRSGLPFYYLPDQDLATKDGLFVPFFGVPAATLTTVPRLAGMTQAQVVPCIVRLLEVGYEIRFYAAWHNYPTHDLAADTRRVNAFIEDRVREMPEQYFWLHKRFKTRPEGEEKFY